MVGVKHNEVLLAVLIFLTFVIVVGLARLWVSLILHNIFLSYSIVLGAALLTSVYTLSHFFSHFFTERKLFVRLAIWTILAPLCFSLTLLTLVYIFGPIETARPLEPGEILWSLTVPKDAYWTWLGIYPLNVIMLAAWLAGIILAVAQEKPSMLPYLAARAERKRIITVYAKSIQTVEGITTPDRDADIMRSLGPHYYPGTSMGEGDTVPVNDFTFPQDQEETIEMVKEIAPKHGFAVRVVDLSREETHDAINVLPTLVSDSRKRVEGKISKEQLESFLSKA